jgi:hypothetical protein
MNKQKEVHNLQLAEEEKLEEDFIMRRRNPDL